MKFILDLIKQLLAAIFPSTQTTEPASPTDENRTSDKGKEGNKNDNNRHNDLDEDHVKRPKTDNMTDQTSKPTKPGTLYALCVGINDYQYVGKLGGCVADTTNVYNYLKETCANTNYTFDAVLLKDADATKANIVKHFKEHLSKAKAGDVAFFFFAGHGAEEKADEVFHPYSQKKTLNTLVCYDSRSPQGVTDLSDKELRYLIGQLTYSTDPNAELPHFVLMMDSCHSGSVTRVDDAQPRLTTKNGARDWSKFIFANEISREDVANAKSLNEVLPQGQHIHFSSCEGTELAYETRGSGVFTTTLLDVLKRTNGKVSYASLNDRIRYYIKNRFPQTPTIYSVAGDNNNAMTQFFMGGASARPSYQVSTLYNTKDRKWILRMGAIQGIPMTGFEQVEVRIMDSANKPLTTATINNVQPDFCYLTINNVDALDIRESYNTDVSGIYNDPVGFYFDTNSHPTAVQSLKDQLMALPNTDWEADFNVSFVDTELAADYVVYVENDEYCIAHSEKPEAVPADAPQQPAKKRVPVVEQQALDASKLMVHMPTFLKTIARRKFIDSLDNPTSQLQGRGALPAAGVEIYKVVDERDRSKDELLPMNADGEVMVSVGDLVSVRTVNNTRRDKLFFTLLYMDMTFGVDATSFGDNAVEMLAGEELWYGEKAAFEALHDDFILDFQLPETRMTFKLIASTAEFSAKELSQDALAAPRLSPSREETSYRALKRRSAPTADDWATTTVHIVVANA